MRLCRWHYLWGWLRTIVLCVLLVLSSHARSLELPAGLNLSDCSIGAGPAKITAQCTTIDVPLNPDDPAAGNLGIAIARIPARRQSKHTDAFTMIAGGPGQSAQQSYQSIASAFRRVGRDRDIILIDQRGTGESAKLECPPSPEALGLQLQFDAEQLTEQAQQCLESLEFDPRLFSTSVAVQDLETIRKHLGISQWNLYGISYGTRVAQHYLRRYPDSVRTMILDAVVPPPVALGPDIAPLAQRALDLVFDRCANSDGCNDAFGHQGERTLALMQDLEDQPRSITYEDIASGKLTTRQFTRNDLAVTLRLMSYSSQTAALLPSMLHDAMTRNNFAPLARQSDLQSKSINDALAIGMHHAIICTEDAPFISSSSAAAEPSYMGEAVVDSIKATCQDWPQGILDEDFKEPLRSDVPTLILSGGADPITPSHYGEQVHSVLNNSYHIVNENEGHMQAPFGCIPIIIARFVDQASTDNLQDDCLKRLIPLPFFVDANGPLP